MILPTAQRHFDKWGAVELAGPLRALIISDLHIPYHHEGSVRLALEFGRERKANLILINGDMLDFFSLSTWEKDPRKRDLAGEVDAGRQFLATLREEFPRAKIVYKEGNHEERWGRYLAKNAPDLLGLEDFTWRSVYRLDRLRIQHVGDCRPVRIGKLFVIHGHEYRFAISNPVNPARGLFLRAKTHALCGHLHQSSQHSERQLDGKLVSTWSTGCLCDLNPDYSPLNQWSHGFAFAEVNADGAFNVTNPRIVEGKVYL